MILINHCRIFILTISILGQGPVFADQHEPEKPETQTEVKVAPQQTTTNTQETKSPSESFMPTETISEDLSVPFPVDI